jgi:hypothetical protein
MNILLKKAKAVKVGDRKTKTIITKDHVELVLAYLTGDITIKAMGIALDKKNPGNSTHFVPKMLKVGIQKGWLEVKLK